MRTFQIAVIGGDGIGPEVTREAIRAAEAAAPRDAASLAWTEFPWGTDYYFRHGRMAPDGFLEELARFDAILLGAVGHPDVQDHVTLNGLLLPIRRRFDQFICLRPAYLYPGIQSPLRDKAPESIDILVFRENVEGEYANVGGRVYQEMPAEVAVQTAVFTRRGCERIIRAAFEGARVRASSPPLGKWSAATAAPPLSKGGLGGVAAHAPLHSQSAGSAEQAVAGASGSVPSDPPRPPFSKGGRKTEPPASGGQRKAKVTSVTKSNAQGYGMVLWDEVFQAVAAEFPDVATESLLVDRAVMEFVRRPESFDVVVASNLFGDILTDLAAIVVGSMGLAASGNIDPTRRRPSMFEPVHGSAPDIAGQGIANPLAAILSAAMMLEHLELRTAAASIRRAVADLLAEGGPRTPDLGGTARTDEVGMAVVEWIALGG